MHQTGPSSETVRLENKRALGWIIRSRTLDIHEKSSATSVVSMLRPGPTALRGRHFPARPIIGTMGNILHELSFGQIHESNRRDGLCTVRQGQVQPSFPFRNEVLHCVQSGEYCFCKRQWRMHRMRPRQTRQGLQPTSDANQLHGVHSGQAPTPHGHDQLLLLPAWFGR